MSKITVLVVPPMERPYVDIIESGLESLQAQVDGMIEAIYPFEDEVALICNEEGKINGLEYNRALYDDEGEMYDIVAGTFLIVGLTEDGFGSLSPELLEKFKKRFAKPQLFLRGLGGKILVI